MAATYLTEFASCGNLGLPIPQAPALATQAITPSSSASTSNVFGAHTNYVEVNTDTPILMAILPAASTLIASTATGWRVPAGVPRLYGVSPGQKFSCIQTS